MSEFQNPTPEKEVDLDNQIEDYFGWAIREAEMIPDIKDAEGHGISISYHDNGNICVRFNDRNFISYIGADNETVAREIAYADGEKYVVYSLDDQKMRIFQNGEFGEKLTVDDRTKHDVCGVLKHMTERLSAESEFQRVLVAT